MQTTVSSQHFNNLMETSNFIDTGIRCKSHLDKVEGIEPGHYLRVWNATEYKIFKLPCDIREVPIFKDHIYHGTDVAKNYLLDQGFYVPGIDTGSQMINYNDHVKRHFCFTDGYYYMNNENVKAFAKEAKEIKNLPASVKEDFEWKSKYGASSINSKYFEDITDKLYYEGENNRDVKVRTYGNVQSYNDFLSRREKYKSGGNNYSYKDLIKYCGNPWEKYFKHVILTFLLAWPIVTAYRFEHDKAAGLDHYYTFDFIVTILIGLGIGAIIALMNYIEMTSNAKRLFKIYEEVELIRDKDIEKNTQIEHLKEKYFNHNSIKEEEDFIYFQNMNDLANCTSVSLDKRCNDFDFGLLDTVYNCLLYFGYPFTFETGEQYRPFYPQEQNRFYGSYQNNLYQVEKYNNYLNKFVLPIIRQNQIEIIDTNLYTLNKYLIEDLRIQMRTDQICNSINSLKNSVHNDSLAIMGQLQKMNRDINLGLREIDNSINNLDMSCYVSTYVTVRN